MICLDEMGPVAAKSYPGPALIRATPPTAPQRPVGRAQQEMDYGRREKGYVFGAFCPATGDAWTKNYPARTTAHWVDFLQAVEQWLLPDSTRVYAIVDNLSTHRASDVLFSLQPLRWEFVFQPK